jgi:phospholipid transport system substrate-binding protein
MTKTLVAWLLIGAAAAAPAVPPRDVVQAAVTRVLGALEAARAGAPARGAVPAGGPAGAETARGEVRRIAADLFDFGEIARRALSRHWGSRTAAEQAEFVTLFTDLIEDAYIGKIESYAGERIVFGTETLDGAYATVRSRILTGRRTDVALDYRLHRADGRWRVYDVLIDGVSFVSTYRSEFNRVIQGSSFDELIDRLRKRSLQPRPGLQG